jgi:hypothetical protein
MRLTIETADDRDYVDGRWATIRAALPMDLTVVDGEMEAKFRRRRQPATDPTPAQPELPRLAGDPPGT